MKGTKRFAASDSNIDANDSIFQSKRVMAGSHFDVHRAETSHQQFAPTLPLDTHRAESSRQHVRALNTQFASWIQTQLQNHPDELWEDGVQDYLTHASNIMDKFSDVVNWLKANAAKGESLSVVGSDAAQMKPVSESKDNEAKFFQEKTGFVSSLTATSFVTSWSSGSLFNNQKPFSFGIQSSVPVNNDASKAADGSQSSFPVNRDAPNDADGEDELEQPSSPSVKKTEEKGIMVVHEVKCKLYVKSSDPADKDTWKDRGTGKLSIKCIEGVDKGTKESKPTILVRNDVGKILLNALLYPGIKTNIQKNSIVAIFHTAGENDGGDSNSVVARTFLIRTKSEEDRIKLAAAIQEYAPTA